MTSTRRIAVVAVVILVAVSGFGLSFAALAQDNGGETAEESGYTLAELKQDGRHYSVDGARIVPSEKRMYWLENRPVNQPWQEVNKESGGTKFGSGEVLKTNRLYLRTIRADTATETVNVTIVYWNEGERTEQQGNTTTTVPVAQNVTVVHETVQLGPGWAIAEIGLPQHTDTKQVTMWLDAHPETARWRFAHRSVATTQPIAISTWGEFLVKIIQYVGLPVLIGGALVGRKVRNAVEGAGIGPQWGFGKWAITITLLTFFAGYLAYTQLAQVIVYMPYIIGFWIVGVFAAYTLATHRGEIHSKGLLQPDITDAVSFSNVRMAIAEEGDNPDDTVATDGGHAELESFAHDVLQGEWQTFLAIHDDEGMSIVRPGFVPFLARVYGARAHIENLHELTSRFKLPNSSPDEIFLVDPEADGLIDYVPPGFELDLPDLERTGQVLAGAGILAAAWTTRQLAIQNGSLVYAGALLLAAWVVWRWFVKPTDGFARIDPAPMHFRQAFASTLMLSKGITDAKDLESAKRQARMERLKTRQEAQDDLDQFDRVLMDHLAGKDVSEELDELGGNGAEPAGAASDMAEEDEVESP